MKKEVYINLQYIFHYISLIYFTIYFTLDYRLKLKIFRKSQEIPEIQRNPKNSQYPRDLEDSLEIPINPMKCHKSQKITRNSMKSQIYLDIPRNTKNP